MDIFLLQSKKIKTVVTFLILVVLASSYVPTKNVYAQPATTIDGPTGPGGATPGIGGTPIPGIPNIPGLGGGGLFVPVKDFAQIMLQTRLDTKEYSLDNVAHLVSRTALQGIISTALTYTNRGNNGNPFYVTNIADHFRGVDALAMQLFINELRSLGVSPDIARAIGYISSAQFRNDIRPNISPYQQNAFSNSFANGGGWNMWTQLLQPNNNYLGQYLAASAELAQRRYDSRMYEQQQLAWGRGYQPATKCIARDIQGVCVYVQTVTPGSFLETQTSQVFASVLRQLEMDDELSEITATILSGMVRQILGNSVTGLLNFSTQSIAPAVGGPGVARTKDGLQQAINVLLKDETDYRTQRNASFTKLQEARTSLSTLLPARIYSVAEPLKTKLMTDPLLVSAVNENRLYATTTIRESTDPALRTLATDINFSTQLIAGINAFSAELQRANTPDDLLRISDRYTTIASQTHSKVDIGQAQQEFQTIEAFANGLIQNVATRTTNEQTIITQLSAPTGTTSGQ